VSENEALTAFEFTINTSLGDGLASFQLPLRSTSNYNCNVKWGDGTEDTITTYNQLETLHAYSVGGVYTITIAGLFESIEVNGSVDKLKLTSILSWGDVGWLTMADAFNGCSNLATISANDAQNLNDVDSFFSAFFGCSFNTIDLSTATLGNLTSTGFAAGFVNNTNLTELDLSSIDANGWTNHNQVVFGCTSIQRVIYPPSGVKMLTAAFYTFKGTELVNFGNIDMSDFTQTSAQKNFASTLTTASYDAILIGWGSQTVQSGVYINFGVGSKYTGGGAAEAGRNSLIAQGWIIEDGGIA
jgi:hypothetical protein